MEAIQRMLRTPIFQGMQKSRKCKKAKSEKKVIECKFFFSKNAKNAKSAKNVKSARSAN